jgi:branched-subunit amino acid transport protein
LAALVSAAWATVLAVGLGTVVLKSVGPVGVAGRRLPQQVTNLLVLVGPAILAALVVTETFASGRSLVVDARLAGLLAGIGAVLLRLPIWAVIVCGGVATALVRLLS